MGAHGKKHSLLLVSQDLSVVEMLFISVNMYWAAGMQQMLWALGELLGKE